MREGVKRVRMEEEEDVISSVLCGPFVSMYITPYLGLLDRHCLSLVNRDLYYTLTRVDDSLHMMRGLWANSRFIRPDDRLQIIGKSGNLECVQYMWETRIPPMPKGPDAVILTHDFVKDAALSGSVPVVKFFLSKTVPELLGHVVSSAMRGFCRGHHDAEATSLFLNADGEWYLPDYDPFQEWDELVSLIANSVHAEMHQLQTAAIGFIVHPARRIIAWLNVMTLCITGIPPVDKRVVDYQWSIVPEDLKPSVRASLLVFCNEEGRVGPHVEYFKNVHLV